MRPILESLAMHLVQTDSTRSGETRVILPNRRSGIFLRRHLACHAPDVRWAPEIIAISDFVDEISQIKRVDHTEAVFHLYDIYRGLKEQPETLDEFYYWGERMISDFDELDKYMVDAEMLFRNIADLKEIEEPMAGLEESQISFIRRFWEGFHEGSHTAEKKQFLEVWEMLPLLYSGLRERLMKRGEGYQGIQYREIAERILRDEMGSPEFNRTVVAGFNALNGCEERIFDWLQNQGAEFFWDYDHFYTDDPFNEAGRFMRENLARFPAGRELDSFRGIDKKKDIRIIELPTDILQAKTVHTILEEKGTGTAPDCTDTAVILCDEELLMPVLLSLPESIGEINVTMGYPMKNTPVSGFVDLLMRLQHNLRLGEDGKAQFYYRDVRSILVHPYMERAGNGHAHPLLEVMTTENLIQVHEELFESEPEKLVFRYVDGTDQLIKYFRNIFQHILDNLSTGERMLPALHREFIFRFLILLNRMEIMQAERPDITGQVMERLLRKALAGLRVPFEGEPLSGIQVMGILETRMLDFRHVILLSMNEEVMPASNIRQSFIPYALRVAFGMPAREDMDAIYAYYFNRLLQRSEKIDLLYNSTTEGVRTGEMSRYLHQIICQWDKEITRPVLEIMARATPSIEIRHTSVTDYMLARYVAGADEEKYLSPSAINTYLDCSLKFYLRYLAGIGEPDEVKEEIDAIGFGTVVHDTIRLLYREIAEKKGGVIEKQELKQLIRSGRTSEVLTDTFRKHHFRGRRNSAIEGQNIIILNVMRKYLLKLIEADMEVTPFTLVSAEQTYHGEVEILNQDRKLRIRLGGKIDRVDRVGETLRVIDYKTGDASQGFPGISALFDPGVEKRNGAALQTLFYAWLLSKEYPDEQVMPGLYVLRSLYGDQFDPALSMGSPHKRRKIDSIVPLEKEFRIQIEQVVTRIFDPKEPFVQTGFESRCRLCDYARICSRNIIA